MTMRKRQLGLSLVEIMVALVLGLVLSAGLFSVFIGSKQTYGLAEAAARMQESGRFALDKLAYDLRMTGHMGLADPGVIDAHMIAEVTIDGESMKSYPANSIAGKEGNAGPDTLIVRYAAPEFGNLLVDMGAPQNPLRPNWLPDDTEKGDLFIISDGDSADLFEVTEVERGNLYHPGLSKAYAVRASGGEGGGEGGGGEGGGGTVGAVTRMSRLVQVKYEIKDTNRVNSFGDPIYALYRNGEELLEGIENMQIKYGVVDAAGNVRYRDWTNSLTLHDIVSVKVGLLLHSIEPVLDAEDDATYELAGVEVAGIAKGDTSTKPSYVIDRRLRRVFETTVTLRNR